MGVQGSLGHGNVCHTGVAWRRQCFTRSACFSSRARTPVRQTTTAAVNEPPTYSQLSYNPHPTLELAYASKANAKCQETHSAGFSVRGKLCA